MGAVNFSIDLSLVEVLRRLLPLRVFVETGTFEGDSVALSLSHFDELHTIELADRYYAAALERFRSDASVTLHHGDSPRVLDSLKPHLERASVLYWLDAHWCSADDTAGAYTQSPLLEELKAIGALNAESVLMIDDARLYLCTPAQPGELGNWPRFHEVVQGLCALSAEHEAMVVNDVILFYPKAIVDDVSEYARAHSIDWLASLRELDELKLEREMLYRTAAERLAAIEELDQLLAAERRAHASDLGAGRPAEPEPT